MNDIASIIIDKLHPDLSNKLCLLEQYKTLQYSDRFKGKHTCSMCNQEFIDKKMKGSFLKSYSTETCLSCHKHFCNTKTLCNYHHKIHNCAEKYLLYCEQCWGSYCIQCLQEHVDDYTLSDHHEPCKACEYIKKLRETK
jgi:hypothetical protein